MNIYVNKTTGQLHFISDESIIIDQMKNTINGIHYIDGIPEGEVVDVTYVEQSDPDHDSRYQNISTSYAYNKTKNTVTLVKSVINWRTLEEVEAEEAAAAEAALDVTPDSA